MRPVNKGTSPYESIDKYSEALHIWKIVLEYTALIAEQKLIMHRK